MGYLCVGCGCLSLGPACAREVIGSINNGDPKSVDREVKTCDWVPYEQRKYMYRKIPHIVGLGRLRMETRRGSGVHGEYTPLAGSW